METKKKNKEKGKEETKRLVIARLEGLPAGKKISMGAEGEFSRDDLIERVEKGDEVGERITEIQLEYLRSLKEGIFYEQEPLGHETQR